MGKRILIFITILLIAGIFTAWYFFAKESKYMGNSPVKAVSLDTPYFIRIRNLGDFVSKTMNNNGLHSIQSIPGLSDLFNDLSIVDSLKSHNKIVGNFLEHKELILLPGTISNVYVLDIVSIVEKNSAHAIFRDYFQAKNITATETRIGNVSVQVYDWLEKGEKRKLITSFYRGLLIVGSDGADLQKAFSQLDRSSLMDDIDFLKIKKNSTENVDINIYLNHKKLPNYLARFYIDTIQVGQRLSSCGKWTEIDLIQRDRQFLANGFTVMDTIMSGYLAAFRHQKPLSGNLTRFMPATTSGFVSIKLSDPAIYFKDYCDFLLRSNQLDTFKKISVIFGSDLKMDVTSYLKKIWTGEAAVVCTNFSLGEPSENRFLLVKTKSEGEDPLAVALKRWGQIAENRKKIPEAVEMAKCNIFPVPHQNFGSLIGESLFGSVQTNWMTIGDGYILIGCTPGSLKRYQTLLQNGELLSERPSYSDFSANLTRSSNFYLWTSPGYSLPFFKQWLRPDFASKLDESGSILKKIENISWQWGFENGMVYNSASLALNPDADQYQVPFWRYRLKAKLLSQPQFVNFSEKGKFSDLIFQGVDNFLTAVDKDGQERWRIRLEAPVVGKFKKIASVKSGEFQLLFNTSQAIHLIDRNGIELKNFPIKLKSPAANEVVAFDYEGKKEFRFLIACRDRSVCNFDKSGRSVTGWQPKVTEHLVEFPVHYFRVDAKDYLVYFDKTTTFILDRQGKVRVKLKEQFVHSKNDIFLIYGHTGTPQLVTTDELGNIRLTGFDGVGKKIVATGFSNAHLFFPASQMEVGSSDFIFLDRDKLSRLDGYGKLISSRLLKEKLAGTPSISTDKKGEMVEIYCPETGKAFLVGKNGLILDSFLPASYNLLTIGSFDRGRDVSSVIACSQDGFLSNFQTILK